MSNNKGNGFRRFVKEKGYYIVLLLCAVTVGVSGYLLLNGKTELVEPTEAPTSTPTASTSTPTASTAKPSVADVVATDGEESAPTESTEQEKARTKIVRPVEGETAYGYYMESLAYNPTTRDWRTHEGLDLTAAQGTKVVSAMDGTVYAIYDDDSLGTTVVVRHADGYTTHYSNLEQSVAVKVGDTVTAGATLGTVGSTAGVESASEPHLHFAVFLNNTPVNPEELLDSAE